MYATSGNTGTVFSIASNGTVTTFAGGFFNPGGAALDGGGNLYVGSGGSVFMITPTAVQSTFVSGMNNSHGMTFDGKGNLYTTDFIAGSIDEITPAGVVNTYATGFSQPQDLVFDQNGNLFVSSPGVFGTGNIYEISPAGVVSTFAAGFDFPKGLAFDHNGNLYVSNSNNGTVSMVTPAGTASTFASGFNSPGALAFDGNGNLYVANTANSTVSMVTPTGVVSTFATIPGSLSDLAINLGAVAPIFATGPQSQFVAGGQDVSFPVYVANTTVSNNYLWQRLPAGASIWANLTDADNYRGTASSILTVSNVTLAMSGDKFRCVVTNPSGSTVSNPATLTALAVVINSQPLSRPVVAGYPATFNVGASGTDLSYQWEVSADNGATWTTLSDNTTYNGVATRTLVVNKATLAMSGYEYECSLTSTFGSSLSSSATMTVQSFRMYATTSAGNVVSLISQSGMVSTLASGFSNLWGVVSDANGNLYVANNGNGTVLLITPTGVVSTFASGLNGPAGLVMDANSNLYVAVPADGSVVKITPAGAMSTFASGFGYPQYLAIDGKGNLYVSNYSEGNVSVVTPEGMVSTYASGFNNPQGLIFDGSGNLYVADSGNNTVVLVTPAGVASVFASGLSGPAGLAFDASGILYVANFNGETISTVSPTGIVSPFVSSGLGTLGYLAIVSEPIPPTITDQPQNQTILPNSSTAFSVGASGASGSNTFQWQRLPAGNSTWINLADSGNYSGTATPTLEVANTAYVMSGDQFRCIVTNALGSTTTQPATLYVFVVGVIQPQSKAVVIGYTTQFKVTANGASIGYQWEISMDQGVTWNVLANDSTYSGVAGSTLTINNTTSAMSAYEYKCILTNSLSSMTTSPVTLTVQPFRIYMADAINNMVVAVAPDGTVSTIASGLYNAEGLAFDANGNLYVANSGLVSLVTPTGLVSTFAGGFDNPLGLAFDVNGNLYVANSGNGTISTVTPAGVVSTFASGFNNPAGLAFDANGNLYVANTGNGTISIISPAGVVGTFASGLQGPQALMFDGSGDLYVADGGNLQSSDDESTTISVISPAGVVSTFADGANSFDEPVGLTFDVHGNLYVTNYFFGQVWVDAPGGAMSELTYGPYAPTYLAITSLWTLPSAIPTIITQPQGQIIAASVSSATFSVAVNGVPGSNTFQWQHLPIGSSTWENLTDGGSYNGCTTPTLTVANTTLAMSGDQFQCIVTNAIGSSTTNSASLTVVAATIDIPPQNQSVLASYPATFSVSASGVNLAYQWQVSIDEGVTWTVLANNVNYSGVTSPVLTVNNTTMAMSGYEYACIAKNVAGSATSSPATLTVQPFLLYGYSTIFSNGVLALYTPDGTATTLATGFNYPQELVADRNGNIYVANGGNGTISQVTPSGVVSTYAAGLNSPGGMAFDVSGNLFVANGGNGTVSVVTPSGVGSAFASGFNQAWGLTLDGNGNCYVANSGNGTISKITSAGVVTTFATGFSSPHGLVFDGSGDLYVANSAGNTVSVVSPVGVVSTFASGFHGPDGLIFDGSGDLYVANSGGNTVSVVTPAGSVSTFASGNIVATFLTIVLPPAAPAIITQPQDQSGLINTNATFSVAVTGAPGSNTFQWQRMAAGSSTWVPLTDNGNYSGSATAFLAITNTTLAMSGDQFHCVVTNSMGSTTSNAANLSIVPVIPVLMYVANSTNGTISQVTAAGQASTLTFGFNSPEGMVIDGSGNLFVANFGSGILSRFSPAGGSLTVAVGFHQPAGLVIDTSKNLYVANSGNGTVSKVTSSGVVSTYASGLNSPTGLAIDASKNLYIANASNNTISKVTAGGVNSTFANGFQEPEGLAMDANGNLYVANTLNGTVSKVTPAGVVSTFASAFSHPEGLAFDANGNLYVANSGNGTVSKVTPAGVVSLFAASAGGTSNFIVTITSAPAITIQPQNRVVTAGQNAVLSATVTGVHGSNAFQWKRLPAGGSSWFTLSDGSLYTGTSTASLTVLNTTASMTGDQYEYVVTNAVGSNTSNPATLTIAPLSAPPNNPPATLGAWQNLWFTPSQLSNSAVSAALATPANDGVANLIKYAFNLSPFSPPSFDGNPPLPQPVVSNGNLVLTFNATQTDLAYSVQASTDLINWTTQGVVIQTNGTQITASYPIPTAGSVFLRIGVTANSD